MINEGIPSMAYEKLEDTEKFPIRPQDIDVSSGFWDAFGNTETEVSARYLVKMAQRHGSWRPFTLDEIEAEQAKALMNELARTVNKKKPDRKDLEGSGIIGWDKIISQLNPKTIDTDSDPMIGELLEVDLPDSPGELFLKVMCGTGRTFVLPVGKGFKTAIDANAATYGIDKNLMRQYEVRT